ncbi:probable protein phosphatase 2C 24 [Zingiber officinale]|uniref:probable protein phosphatase 2C 24 n=1 Tax=Zingiber officinale TaxID=94328 RepID=UPI001C4C7EED|nr:probable protein phosphatase 2C 24 [Zingiber officinale]
MAAHFLVMAGEGDSPEKCREPRRRRIETSPLEPDRAIASSSSTRAAVRRPEIGEVVELLCPGDAGSGKRYRAGRSDQAPLPISLSPLHTSSSSSSSTSSPSGGDASIPAIASSSMSAPALVDTSIMFGFISLSGRSREMEDAVSVQPGFFRRDGRAPLHFFAVFDGHGGSHVSALCKERMHVILGEELSQGEATDGEEVAWMRAAVERSFARMEDLALSACACGRVGLPLCRCDRSGIESDIVGSTAVVALLDGNRKLVVANCGDSRAVLSRGGQAVPLTDDHKPDRPDELARIEGAGGRVIYFNGARVSGMLAMSRALGDKYLKAFVTSEPEICVLDRSPEDECLIIASDGLWDVIPNEVACNVARQCLAEADPPKDSEILSGIGGGDEAGGPEKEQASDAENKQPSDSRCSLAAALLARLALARNATDNISVVVIDLRRINQG